MKRRLFTNIEGTCHVRGSNSGGDYKSSLERSGAIDFLLNPEVFEAQFAKPRIFYLDREGKKRRYTADLSVTFHAGLSRRPLAIEFKYEQELRRKPELHVYFDVIQAELDRLSFDFELRTEKDVFTEEFPHKEFIWGYYNDERSPFEAEVRNAIRRHETITVGALLDGLRLDSAMQLNLVPVIWRLVAHKVAFIDFRELPCRKTVIHAMPLERGMVT